MLGYIFKKILNNLIINALFIKKYLTFINTFFISVYIHLFIL